jgi:hypothetical protein
MGFAIIDSDDVEHVTAMMPTLRAVLLGGRPHPAALVTA